MLKHIVSLVSRFIPRHHLQHIAAFALRIIGLFFVGKRFTDPIDGRSYRKLLPYGRIVTRRNALAPFSMSLERHRLIWLYLRERTNFFKEEKSVLHIAPEYCFFKRFAKLKNIYYTTADLISPWANLKFDVQSIPLPNSSFDVIICNHVLEHVPNDLQAMTELYRVMKPGGFGIFQVPIDGKLDRTFEDPSINTPALRELHYGQRDHLRQYGRDYPERLRKAGFIVTEDHFVQTLPRELVTRYSLPHDEDIYLCVKPF